MINPAENKIAPAAWRKSSYSGGGNNCVEVAHLPGAAAVRDSKDPEGGHLVFSAEAWETFLTGIKRGEHAR